MSVDLPIESLVSKSFEAMSPESGTSILPHTLPLWQLKISTSRSVSQAQIHQKFWIDRHFKHDIREKTIENESLVMELIQFMELEETKVDG